VPYLQPTSAEFHIHTMTLTSARQAHGKGKAILHAFGKETSFSELSYTYPLKLLSPKLPSDGIPVSIVYILSYGGGLVPGDKLDLEVEVGAGASLMVLTQAILQVLVTR
jgi:urease accessory protein